MGNKNTEKLPLKEKERWELFYNLTKDVFNREENRYKRIEEKALTCLTAFSLLLVIYGFLWNHVLNTVIPPKCVAEIVLSVFSVLLTFFFIFSWIITFRIFRTKKRKIMPLHEHMVKYFKDVDKDNNRRNNLADLYFNLGEINREAYEENCKITEEEIKQFKLGFNMILATAIAFIFFIAMYSTYLWSKCSLKF